MIFVGAGKLSRYGAVDNRKTLSGLPDSDRLSSSNLTESIDLSELLL